MCLKKMELLDFGEAWHQYDIYMNLTFVLSEMVCVCSEKYFDNTG